MQFVLDKCLGAIETVTPTAVPEGYAVAATNVELSAWSAMIPRVGTAMFDRPSVSGEIHDLFTERISGEAIWAFSDFTGTPVGYRRDPVTTAWATITLIDTPAYNGVDVPQVVACAYNGKVFLAYNSSVNRLHVWDGTSVRRVGLGPSAAPSVANTGAGAYAATLRYYKIQWRIRDAGGATIATSELSPVTSFTPSGTGTAARVTKPTTVDGATHWCVYGSFDGITFYNISGVIAVGTTIYDDVTAPSAYSGGVIAPEVGLFPPPPSAKFLATNGERLFMAGSYETTAATGQTTPGNRRVWFTRPIGVTDAGDDESITQTTESRYYLDIDNEDGSPLTALASTLDGSIYALTQTSVWRLVDTGQVDKPIRAERVASGAGVESQNLVTIDTTTNSAMLYFCATDGPYRYSPSGGLEYLGADVVTDVDTVGSLLTWRMRSVGFDPATRRVFWFYGDDDSGHYGKARVLTPAFMTRMDGVLRGGWSRVDWSAAYPNRLNSSTVYGDRILIGGAGPVLFSRDDTATTDDGTGYTASIQSRTFVAGDGMSNWLTEEPYIWKPKALAVSLTLSPNFGGSTYQISDTAPTVSVGGGEASYHRQKVEGAVVADAFALDVTMSVTAPLATSAHHRDGVDKLVIPVSGKERG